MSVKKRATDPSSFENLRNYWIGSGLFWDGLLGRLFLVDAQSFRAPGIDVEAAARSDAADRTALEG